MRHLTLKISALIVATTLWVFVSLNLEYDKDISLPLVLKNIPETMALDYLPPDSISLKIRGKGTDLLFLSPEKLPVEINLSNFLIGDSILFLNPTTLKNQKINNEYRVLEIQSPQTLSIELEPKLIRQSEVLLNLEVIPQDGFVVVNKLEAFPKSVNIVGGRRAIARTINVPSSELRIEGVNNDSVLIIPLENPEPKRLKLENESVKVEVKVQKLGEKSFKEIPVVLIPPTLRDSFTLEPKQAKLTIRGGEKDLEKVELQDLYLFIDFNRFSIEGKEELSPSVRLPETVLSHSVFPETFKLVKKNDKK